MQLIERTLGILETVAEPPQGKSLTEISQIMRLPLPTAHRLLAALVAMRYVRRDDATNCYHPGPALTRLASLPLGGTDIVALCEPHLEQLAAEFGETVFVAQLVNGHAVCVTSLPSTRALHVQVQVGRDLPLHASAAARTLLAFRPEAEARNVLDGHRYDRFTDSTPRDEAAVLRHLREIRRVGHDLCEDELDANVWAVAAPLMQDDGRALASLAVALPRERLAPHALRAEITASVLRHAEEISAQLPATRRRAETH